ncbi:MAG: glycosyltransferase [Propionibacteriales bacterium]|nr:glycosyltransferase [Propionibacteriales bacterium]
MDAVWPPVPPAVVGRDALPPQPDLPKVKVLHVITRFIAGSGGNTLLSATGMDRDQYELWVAAMPGGPLWEQAERCGVRTVHVRHMREQISPVHDLLACFELARLMRRERFSVVHTHCSKAGVIGRVAARIARVPAVVHTFHIFAAHEGLPRWRRWVYLALDRLVRSFAQRYVAVAPRVAWEAVEQRIAPAGTTVVVPSAIELAGVPHRPDPAVVRAELGVPEHAPLVGTVGRIVAQKAPLDFVRMAAQVRAARPDAEFVMVGDTTLESASLEAETRREAKRLGVPIRFTGFRPDAPQIAACLDVYVVPSRYEGLGRAVTEAMASGRPVVATAVNGVPDLVEPGATGLLARPGDPASLAASVLWMLDHPDAARRMGAQGRERVRRYFGQPQMCRALDRIYRELLGLPDLAVVNEHNAAEYQPATPNGRPLRMV